ncbi:MAG: hypothetical protein GYB31_10080 [Bacteroidetes bacterium]|nr:hypothetical protein [Bacteroidota bacterium]
MEERDILDHFDKQPELRPDLLRLCLWGLLLGIPAGLVHFFFLRILPPPGGLGWLKGIVLLCNQSIFLIMILSYLAKRLQLFNAKRQFYFGAAFAVSSVISVPVFALYLSLPPGYTFLSTSVNIGFLLNTFTLAAIAISLLLLILFIRQYGEAFVRGPQKASDDKKSSNS